MSHFTDIHQRMQMDPITGRVHQYVARAETPSQRQRRKVVLYSWLLFTTPFAPITFTWSLVSVPIAYYKAKSTDTVEDSTREPLLGQADR